MLKRFYQSRYAVPVLGCLALTLFALNAFQYYNNYLVKTHEVPLLATPAECGAGVFHLRTEGQVRVERVKCRAFDFEGFRERLRERPALRQLHRGEGHAFVFHLHDDLDPLKLENRSALHALTLNERLNHLSEEATANVQLRQLHGEIEELEAELREQVEELARLEQERWIAAPDDDHRRHRLHRRIIVVKPEK